MFVEAKRSLNPVFEDRGLTGAATTRSTTAAPASRSSTPASRTSRRATSRSADFFTRLVSMKDLPDGTFPGILRELMVLDFPVVVNAEVTIPDQTKMIVRLQGPA